MSYRSKLMPVAKKCDFPPEFKVGFRIEQVKTGCRGACQNILADAMQEHLFEQFFSVLPESWNVELNDRSRTLIGRDERLVASRPDISVDTRLAFAEDTARSVPSRRSTGVIQPGSIARRDQHFRIDTAKAFGIGVFDDGKLVREVHDGAIIDGWVQDSFARDRRKRPFP